MKQSLIADEFFSSRENARPLRPEGWSANLLAR
jgi:hypothetical protein